MEILGLVNLPWWLVSFLLLVFTIILYTYYKRSFFKRHGFVTKDSIFFLGDLSEIGKKGFTIYDVEQVRKYGKIYGTYMGNSPMLMVSDPEFVKTISIKQFNNFSERMAFASKPFEMNDGLSAAEGVHWKYLRSVMGRCFTSGRLRTMNTNISKCMERFIDNVENKRSENSEGFDVVKLFQAYTMDVICSTGFGMDVDSQRDPENQFVKYAQLAFSRQFFQNIVIVINMFFPDLPGLRFVTFREIEKKVTEFFQQATESLLADRKKENADHRDMLQAMLEAQREDIDESIVTETEKVTMEDLKRKGLTDAQVIRNSILFMLAAYETTSITLSWLVYDLVIHTEVQEKVIKEIDEVIAMNKPNYDSLHKLHYLDMVINETGRFHPVATVMMRQAEEDTEVCGVHIPAKMGVVFPAFALHFMEEYWDEPLTYDPERFAPENKDNLNEYAYIPFGMGPRNCIGMRLALLEIKMCIVTILQKYRIEKTDALSIPMPGDMTSLYKPAKPVLVKFVERK